MNSSSNEGNSNNTGYSALKKRNLVLIIGYKLRYAYPRNKCSQAKLKSSARCDSED